MEDDKVEIGRNGNIPITPKIPISNEEDATTMTKTTTTPLPVTSDDENVDTKNSNNKNITTTTTSSTKKDMKNIKSLEDDIKEIFGERSSSNSEKITPKSSKLNKPQQRKSSIGSTGSGGGGGGGSSNNNNKSLNKNIIAKSPTRNQQLQLKNSPTILLKSVIKNEIIEPSTSKMNCSIGGKRSYKELKINLTITLPNDNEYLYGFDENGLPIYGPLAKKIKGENIDDADDPENDEIQLNTNENKNPLVLIENPPEMKDKIIDENIIKTPRKSSDKLIKTTEMITEDEDNQAQIDIKEVNEKECLIDGKIFKELPLPSTPTTTTTTDSTTTPTIQTNNTPIISKLKPSEDPIYRKPFDMGWKREIVLRALPGSKDKGEVYYITPNGKKLRTRNEIQSHLTIGLTLDNFTFSKDPLGAGPDEEIIRSAKITGRTSDIILGKRIPKPKAPKGASPPPQQQQQSSTSTSSTTNATAGTQNWSYNSNKSSSKSTTDRHSHHNSSSSSSSPRISTNTRVSEDNSGTTGNKLASSKISSSKSNKKGEPCTIQCLPAIGMIPQLQCIKCLCLYHHECVGLDRYNDYPIGGIVIPSNFGNNDNNRNNNTKFNQKDYECASCKNQSSNSSNLILPETQNFLKNTTTPTANPINSGNIQRNTKNTKSTFKSNDNTGSSSGGGGNCETINNQNINLQQQQQQNPFINSSNNDLNIEKSSTMPQSIAVLNGRKYLVIRKPGIPIGIEQHESTSSSSGGLQTGDSSSLTSKKRSSSGQRQTGGPSTSNLPVKIQKIDTFANNFFGNVSLGYDVLLEIFQYLKVQELLRAACVCRVWNVVANHRSLWKTVRMKNSQVNDWSGLAASLRRNETQHLDLRKMLCLNSSEDQMWSNFAEHIKSVITLQKIDLGRCSANVVQNLFLTTPQLRYLNAISIRSDTLNLQNLNLMKNLEELRLKTDSCNLDGDLKPLELLTNLRHLSLTSINELGIKNINCIGNLINLESLEIGECSQINHDFAIQILPKLIKLERLRLEKSTETHVTFELLKTISQMKNLLQLELVNFDIRDGFESKIIECKYLKRLLLIPTYISQSATTNQIILSSMRKLTTLDSLTWVVTMELLRVTALYVDQCEDVTKGKKTFDESIPVLKPVPGTNYNDDDNINKQTSDVQQVEILPLSKIRELLSDGMPNTKFKIVKVAYHATWRQSYVE